MSKQKKFLFILSAKGGGDRPPVIALALALKDRGHQVMFLCDEESAQQISTTNIPTSTFPLELDGRGQIGKWINKINQGEVVKELSNPMSDWANPLIPFSTEVLSEFKPDLIISTLFGIGLANPLSKDLGIPWCFINPSFYFGENAVSEWEEDWYGPFIPKLAKFSFLPLVKEADLVLHATDPEFDFQPTQLPKNHHYVGFLLWEPQDNSSLDINSPGDPWALITLSSVRQEDEAIFANAAIQALANQPVRTLLTQPDKDIQGELDNLPNNVTISGFVPHSPILKNSTVVINHAGHGIVSKAMKYGVPMVLLPWDRDQLGVAARAEKLGIAKVIPREIASAKEVHSGILSIFQNSEYREAAAYHANRLAKMDSNELASNLIEKFLD